MEVAQHMSVDELVNPNLIPLPWSVDAAFGKTAPFLAEPVLIHQYGR